MSKLVELTIEKLVPGGQGLARLSDGRVAFIWGALPGEVVEVLLTKQRRKLVEGVVTKVIKPSTERIEPTEESYIATSPWQIMTPESESLYKQSLLREIFKQHNIELPEYEFVDSPLRFGYRNKMEFSFWWVPETDKVELAFFRRGSHSKIVVDGSNLAMPSINKAVSGLVKAINDNKHEARNMKSVIIRTNQEGKVVGSLFFKSEVEKFEVKGFDGFEVWQSNPQSPASVPTSLLWSEGDTDLTDKILGREFKYNVRSFFQVNLPIYEQALSDIKLKIDSGLNVVDMYSGVGSLGLSVTNDPKLVELDKTSYKYLIQNAGKSNTYQASSESSFDLITKESCLIVDPPRAGLHRTLTDKIVEIMPKQLVHLSCDPSTQARDLKILTEAGYKLDYFKAYNFFPCTPHIESLAILS